MAESARAELGGALKPADDLPRVQQARDAIHLVRVGIGEMVVGLAIVEDFFDLLIRERWAQERSGHFGRAREFRVPVEREPCGAER